MAVPHVGEGCRQATREELIAAGIEFEGDNVIHPVGLVAHIGGDRRIRDEDLHVRIPLESVLFHTNTGQLSFPNPIDP